jgi:hypothetical protein
LPIIISGIHAAGLEHEGIGSLFVEGRDIIFVQNDGLRVAWQCKTENDAKRKLRFFRSAAAEEAKLQ